jgi:hypothetical protein
MGKVDGLGWFGLRLNIRGFSYNFIFDFLAEVSNSTPHPSRRALIYLSCFLYHAHRMEIASGIAAC